MSCLRAKVEGQEQQILPTCMLVLIWHLVLFPCASLIFYANCQTICKLSSYWRELPVLQAEKYDSAAEFFWSKCDLS